MQPRYNPFLKDDERHKRFDSCVQNGIMALDLYFPEIRAKWETQEYDFEGRVAMTLYLEMIHAGLIK